MAEFHSSKKPPVLGVLAESCREFLNILSFFGLSFEKTHKKACLNGLCYLTSSTAFASKITFGTVDNHNYVHN